MPITYNNLKRNVVGSNPIPARPFPTKRDYQQGYMVRYFAKKVNDVGIIEIDKRQFDSYGKKPQGIDEGLYQIISLKWKVSGPINDILDSSGNITMPGVTQTNLRTLKRKEKEMQGIGAYLSSPLEFWQKK